MNKIMVLALSLVSTTVLAAGKIERMPAQENLKNVLTNCASVSRIRVSRDGAFLALDKDGKDLFASDGLPLGYIATDRDSGMRSLYDLARTAFETKKQLCAVWFKDDKGKVTGLREAYLE